MLTLLKNGQVYAPEPLGKRDLLLGGGKILQIADRLDPPEGWAVEVVDADGLLVLPGLIDSHVHILGGGGEGSYHTRTPEITLSQITSGGVTTLIGCIGTDGVTRSMASLVAKARGLTEEGVSCWVYTGSYQVPVRTLTGSILDDLVLIDKVIGTGEIAISDHRSSQPTREEFAKIVADTRLGGILSGKAGVVNIHMGDGARKLDYLRYVVQETEIPARNMVPTHINRSGTLMRDGIDYALTCGGLIDLTTSSDPEYLEPDEVKASTGLRQALDAGVPASQITFSSDGQGSMPIFRDGVYTGLGVGEVSSLWRETRDAVLTEGIPLETALAPVTTSPADIYKLPGKGRIEIGADADLCLVRADELTVDTVFAMGRMMVRAGELLVRGTFES